MKRHAYQIDTLRLFAMLLVFLNHAILIPQCGGKAKMLYDIYAQYGQYAVEFFIILSGMLVAYKYKAFDVNDKVQYMEYVKNKALRLYPIHWVCILFFLPVSFCLFPNGQVLAALPFTILLIQSCFPHSVMPINAPAWTISVLMLFYVATPWLMSRLIRIRNMRLCVLFLICFLVTEYFWLSWLKDTFNSSPWAYHAAPHTRVFTYLIGLMLGHIIRNTSEPTIIKRNGTLMEAFALLAVCVAFWYCKRQTIMIYPTLVMLIYVMWWGRGLVSHIFCLRVFRDISKLSFTFYMVHYWFISISLYLSFFVWKNFTIITLPEAISISISCLILSLVAAWLLHRYVENTLTNKIRTKFNIK